MRSKVAKKILEETPEEVKIFVRRYTDIVMRINQILKAKMQYPKRPVEKMKKKPLKSINVI